MAGLKFLRLASKYSNKDAFHIDNLSSFIFTFYDTQQVIVQDHFENSIISEAS